MFGRSNVTWRVSSYEAVAKLDALRVIPRIVGYILPSPKSYGPRRVEYLASSTEHLSSTCRSIPTASQSIFCDVPGPNSCSSMHQEAVVSPAYIGER